MLDLYALCIYLGIQSGTYTVLANVTVCSHVYIYIYVYIYISPYIYLPVEGSV